MVCIGKMFLCQHMMVKINLLLELQLMMSLDKVPTLWVGLLEALHQRSVEQSRNGLNGFCCSSSLQNKIFDLLLQLNRQYFCYAILGSA